MAKAQIKRGTTKKITLIGRTKKFEYREGYEHGNGISVEPKPNGYFSSHREHFTITPTEGYPEDWIDSFVNDLMTLRRAIIESRTKG